MEISIVYDAQFNTWNAMLNNKCLFYGDIFELEQWLIDNKHKYKEEL
jgi:hypothetical protein